VSSTIGAELGAVALPPLLILLFPLLPTLAVPARLVKGHLLLLLLLLALFPLPTLPLLLPPDGSVFRSNEPSDKPSDGPLLDSLGLEWGWPGLCMRVDMLPSEVGGLFPWGLGALCPSRYASLAVSAQSAARLLSAVCVLLAKRGGRPADKGAAVEQSRTYAAQRVPSSPKVRGGDAVWEMGCKGGEGDKQGGAGAGRGVGGAEGLGVEESMIELRVPGVVKARPRTSPSGRIASPSLLVVSVVLFVPLVALKTWVSVGLIPPERSVERSVEVEGQLDDVEGRLDDLYIGCTPRER
jgi:hypothetical protein